MATLIGTHMIHRTKPSTVAVAHLGCAGSTNSNNITITTASAAITTASRTVGTT